MPATDPRASGIRDLSDIPQHPVEEIGHFFDINKILEPGKGTDVRDALARATAPETDDGGNSSAPHRSLPDDK